MPAHAAALAAAEGLQGFLGFVYAAQVKCLRVLQYFPPPEDPAVAKALNEVLARIITGSDAAKNVNKNNAQHAIVFEAIALALALEADPDLLTAGARCFGITT